MLGARKQVCREYRMKFSEAKVAVNLCSREKTSLKLRALHENGGRDISQHPVNR